MPNFNNGQSSEGGSITLVLPATSNGGPSTSIEHAAPISQDSAPSNQSQAASTTSELPPHVRPTQIPTSVVNSSAPSTSAPSNQSQTTTSELPPHVQPTQIPTSVVNSSAPSTSAPSTQSQTTSTTSELPPHAQPTQIPTSFVNSSAPSTPAPSNQSQAASTTSELPPHVQPTQIPTSVVNSSAPSTSAPSTQSQTTSTTSELPPHAQPTQIPTSVVNSSAPSTPAPSNQSQTTSTTSELPPHVQPTQIPTSVVNSSAPSPPAPSNQSQTTSTTSELPLQVQPTQIPAGNLSSIGAATPASLPTPFAPSSSQRLGPPSTQLGSFATNTFTSLQLIVTPFPTDASTEPASTMATSFPLMSFEPGTVALLSFGNSTTGVFFMDEVLAPSTSNIFEQTAPSTPLNVTAPTSVTTPPSMATPPSMTISPSAIISGPEPSPGPSSITTSPNGEIPTPSPSTTTIYSVSTVTHTALPSARLSNLKIGIIAAGVALFLLCVSFLVLYLIRRRNNKKAAYRFKPARGRAHSSDVADALERQTINMTPSDTGFNMNEHTMTLHPYFASYDPQALRSTPTFDINALPQRGEGVHTPDSLFSREKHYDLVPEDFPLSYWDYTQDDHAEHYDGTVHGIASNSKIGILDAQREPDPSAEIGVAF
ncbi:hypothetical protein BYT27DRAFT_7189970 [Phlegmacium glaucopus]|nr:hypothetical protein BYT27DRAFT_7189970 [Phlegmacium glaucopus]